LHFIAACMKLQVALERFVALGSGGGFEEACASNPLVGALALQLMQTAGLPPNASTGLLAERLESANLACMYPLVACYLGDREREYKQKGVTVAHEAYDHMCALNQLIVTASLIQLDLKKGTHKYAAHKLALLYQAVNLSKVRREELRKRIEEHFEDVKTATDHLPSAISPDLVDWLARICADIVSFVHEGPSSLPQKLMPALRFLSG